MDKTATNDLRPRPFIRPGLSPCLSFAPIVALHAVTLATPDGQPLLENLDLVFGADRTGLVGRNGIGKSTLLRVIAGEARPLPARSNAPAASPCCARRCRPPTATRSPTSSASARRSPASAGWRPARLAGRRGRSRLDARSAAGGGARRGRPCRCRRRPAARHALRRRAHARGARRRCSSPSRTSSCSTSRPTISMPTGARPSPACLPTGRRARSWSATTARCSAPMDRIVELSSLGARIYGGGYDLYAARKAEERAAAERDLDVAKRDAGAVERRIQTARERKHEARRAGRAQPRQGRPAEDPARRAEGAQPEDRRRRQRARRAAARRRGGSAGGGRSRGRARRRSAVRLPSTGLPAGRTRARLRRGAGFAYAAARRRSSPASTSP